MGYWKSSPGAGMPVFFCFSVTSPLTHQFCKQSPGLPCSPPSRFLASDFPSGPALRQFVQFDKIGPCAGEARRSSAAIARILAFLRPVGWVEQLSFEPACPPCPSGPRKGGEPHRNVTANYLKCGTQLQQHQPSSHWGCIMGGGGSREGGNILHWALPFLQLALF